MRILIADIIKKVWKHRVLAALLLVICAFGVQLGLIKMTQVSAAYSIANSARFISGNTGYLNKTLTTPTDATKWTWSGWVKLAKFGSVDTAFMNAYSSGSSFDVLAITSNDTLAYYTVTGGVDYGYAFTPVFRDPAAWQHIVYQFDSTQGVATDRIRVYVNGIRVTGVGTSYGDIPLNFTAVTDTAVAHYIGRRVDTGHYLDGYMSDIYFVDGQAPDPTAFGEYDTNRYWRPKTYGGTYGTNGFKLAFGNSAALGTDTSGAGNDFTVNNLTSTDQMTDTPTSSFAVMNPLDVDPSTAATFTKGNLTVSTPSTGFGVSRSNIGVSSGKWYWEVTPTVSGVDSLIGVANSRASLTTYLGNEANAWAYWANNGNKLNNNSGGSGVAYGSSYTTNDVIGVALDMDAGTLVFYKNNTSQGTAYTGLSGTLFPAISDDTNGAVSFAANFNFGQGGVSGLTYDSASGGFFKYTPPSGYKALSTANLPEPAIAAPKNYFDALVYTGTGAATSTTWANFQPDLVWIKDRSAATSSLIFDTVRTATNYWSSNSSNAEQTAADTLTSFLSNGFSLGAATGVNTNGNNYVSWLWKESSTSGVDIVAYSGDNTSNRNLSHALGAAPDMVVVKRRDSTGDPYIWTSDLTSAAYFLKLDTTDQQTNTNTPWGTGNFSSTQFMVTNNGTNNANASGASYVAYLFKNVDGFSKVGIYTGNGSADGPFVYIGFKPKYVMIKSISGTSNGWFVFDTARNTYNPANTYLEAEANIADTAGGSTYTLDTLANGFKLRGAGGGINLSSSVTYLYAAFAEIPFKYSAQPTSAAAVLNSATTFLMGMAF